MLTVITFQVVPAIAITMPLSATAQIRGKMPGMTSEIAKTMYDRIIAAVAPSFLLTRCPIRPPTIEPIESDSPLLRLENVILTPHMAVQTTDAIMRFMQANGEQVENALNGTYANVVNPEVLGKLACS